MENIIIKLKNCPFEYRDKLYIPKDINFGLELELDKIESAKVKQIVKFNMGKNWDVKNDKSLTKGKNAEIVSPVLQNNKETWILLKKLGELLQKLNPSYDRCSFQINFDGYLLPKLEDKLRFLKLYAMYEDIIYKFSKGEDMKYRYSMETYAAPIILSLKGALSSNNNEIINNFSDQKRYGICFKSESNLIEFRTPNMSNNPIYFQNYINTFYHLLMCAISNKYNKEEVDKYINEFSEIYILESYEKENIDKALRFSKMIFNKSVDQINFMHQYLGK